MARRGPGSEALVDESIRDWQVAASLSVITFIAVAREGFETALFLLGAETTSSSGGAVAVGGIIGVVLAAVIGVGFYTGSARVDLRRFFQFTGGLLFLFAAGLFAKGLHEFRELFEIEASVMAATVWNVTAGPFAEGQTLHDFVKSLFGWSPHPERVRLVGYLAYLIPALWLFYRHEPTNATDPENDPTADNGRQLENAVPGTHGEV